MAVLVYVGMSLLRPITMANNPAVLSAFSIMASTLVMAAGVLLERKASRANIAGTQSVPYA